MKKFISLLLALMLLLSLCACGSSAPQRAGFASDSAEMAADVPMEEPMPEEEALGGFAAEEQFSSAENSSSLPAIDPDKIIYSADATIETTDFDKSVEGLMQLVNEKGGFVESSSLNSGSYYAKAEGYATRSASYTIRVPSSSFSALMGSLSSLGNVPYSNTYSENISSQYYDTDARLTAYRAQEARLVEMMETAETVEDIILLEDRLTELRYKIESLQSTINNWDRQVSYSSICLEVREVEEYSPEAPVSYGQELLNALTGALKSTGRFFKNLLVFIVSALPALIIIAVITVIIVLIVRRKRAKRRAKMNQVPVPNMPNPPQNSGPDTKSKQ